MLIGSGQVINGFKINLGNDYATVLGKYGPNQIWRSSFLRGGLAGTRYLDDAAGIVKYTTKGGVFKNIFKSNALTGAGVTLVINTGKLAAGAYDSTNDYLAETGKDLTIVGASAVGGALAAAGATMIMGATLGSVVPGVGTVVGAVVGLGIGLYLESQHGQEIQNYFEDTIIPGAENVYNSVTSTLTNAWNSLTSWF
jgi:phage tail tape-measure protein